MQAGHVSYLLLLIEIMLPQPARTGATDGVDRREAHRDPVRVMDERDDPPGRPRHAAVVSGSLVAHPLVAFDVPVDSAAVREACALMLMRITWECCCDPLATLRLLSGNSCHPPESW